MVSARLKKIFGRVAAVTSLAATMVFYALGFQIGAAYYQQWQQNKADATAVTQTWDASQHNKTDNLPWAPAGGALAASFAAGAAAIGIAKSRKRDAGEHLYANRGSSGYGGYGSYNSYNNYNSSNDGFFWGYLWGSSGRSGGSSSSSSSSSDNGGAAAAVVIVAGVALAASASVVSGIALKDNFSKIPGEDELIASQSKKAEPAPVVTTPAPANTSIPAPEMSEIGGGKKKGFSL